MPSIRVVSRLACSLVGEVRRVTPIPGTRFAAICGTEPFEGYHYCSFGLDPAYVEPLERAGVVVGATAPDAGVEAIELPEHPFFLATAFQPQVGAGCARSARPAARGVRRSGSRALTVSRSLSPRPPTPGTQPTRPWAPAPRRSSRG